jgi:hypothetical protein
MFGILLAGYGKDTRLPPDCLLISQFDIVARREGGYFKTLGIALDHTQGAAADGSSGT